MLGLVLLAGAADRLRLLIGVLPEDRDLASLLHILSVEAVDGLAYDCFFLRL